MSANREEKEPSKLTEKQRAFCAEYLVDLNATQAAIRAGYSQKTAASIGQENLRKPEIQQEVQRLMAERANRVEVSADRVLKELMAMAFYDPADLTKIKCPDDIVDQPEHVRRAIVGWGWDKGGRFTLKIAGKTPQLELIGRHLKMFTDRHEHSGKDGGPIEVAKEYQFSPEDEEAIRRIAAGRLKVKDAQEGDEPQTP